MGANFVTKTVDGSKTDKELEVIFGQLQDSDRYENGHSYSGGIGMADGLLVVDKQFDDRQSAEDWLEEHCVKWHEAKAVKFRNSKGAVYWLIGAWCSS